MPMIIKVLGGWCLLLLIMPFLGNGRVAVLSMQGTLPKLLKLSDASLIDEKNHFYILEAPSVLKLYLNGAFLVLPSTQGGCGGNRVRP